MSLKDSICCKTLTYETPSDVPEVGWRASSIVLIARLLASSYAFLSSGFK